MDRQPLRLAALAAAAVPGLAPVSVEASPDDPADIEAARRALEAAGAREHALDVAAELTVRARERIAALPLDETVRAEFADACHAVLTRRS